MARAVVPKEKPVLAVDLGGTKIIVAVISGKYKILAEERFPTLANEGVQAVTNRLFSAIDGVLTRNKLQPSQLAGISMAIAGPIDAARGLITVSPNLPDWHYVPLARIVKDKYSVDTFLINDARAATLGEHRLGAGKGTRHMLMLTLGTGIGGGIIIDGALYQGASGSAGELGHMVIVMNGMPCGCGNNGCLEAMASGRAVARDTILRLSYGQKSSLAGTFAGKIESITAKDVGEAARKGDALALDVLSNMGRYLGLGMSNLVNIFNPEMIVVGGGMAHLGELILGPARRMVADKAFKVSANAVKIVTAKLREEAGVYGAAVWAREGRGKMV